MPDSLTDILREIEARGFPLMDTREGRGMPTLARQALALAEQQQAENERLKAELEEALRLNDKYLGVIQCANNNTKRRTEQRDAARAEAARLRAVALSLFAAQRETGFDAGCPGYSEAVEAIYGKDAALSDAAAPAKECQRDAALAEVARLREALEGGKQRGIDVSNLRFYARLFREHGWEIDVLHWSVFEATLNDIAGRLVALSDAAAPAKDTERGHGSGPLPGSGPVTVVQPDDCRDCDGTGNLYRNDEDGDFLPCDSCGGTGNAQGEGGTPWIT